MLNKEFELHIIEKTKGFLSSCEIDEFFSKVQDLTGNLNFSPSSLANLERIILSQFNLPSFIKDSLKYEHHLEIASLIAANSNYLSDVVVKSPGLLYRLFVAGFLQSEIEEEKLRLEVTSSLAKYKSFEAKVRYFRRLKNRMMLKIAVSDLLGLHDFRKIVRELSVVAKVIVSEFFDLCFEEVCNKHSFTESIKKDYVVAALGKLGGRELNYSSDIDLLFFFDENKKIGEKKIEYYEALHEAIRLFIEKATEQTADGFLYRVDIRLRPDGKYSPLAKTFSDYMRYYETRGEDWERQMLLKLDFIGGNREVFEKFRQLITPFIFRKSVPAKYLKQVFDMKRAIEKESADDLDIKRCVGGIRDVEFSVQALQILYGKNIRELETGNTLEAIVRLKINNLLSESEAKELEESYIFYRKIEHFLQLRNDTQTHTIPASQEELQRLSRFMNFEREEDFLTHLNSELSKTRKIFLQIIELPESFDEESKQREDIDFIDKKRAEKNFLYIAKGENITGIKKFDERTIKLAAEVLPLIKSNIPNSPFPDLLLENLRKIIESIPLPSVLYSELRDKKTLNLLVKSILRSDRFVADILKRPDFIDDFLSRAAFVITKNFETLDSEKVRFYLNLQLSHGLITTEEFSLTLQRFYEDKIRSIFRETNFEGNLFVASMGGLGSGELTFGSDLDLLIVAEKESEETEKAAAEFLNILQKKLHPIEVDFRLRPEGESSRLVWGMKAYEKYFAARASVWEFLSLTKLHFIDGNESLFNAFKSAAERSYSRFNSGEIKSESQKMYRKVLETAAGGFSRGRIDLKKNHGYLKTIDFLLAASLAINSKKNFELIGNSTGEKLKSLSKIGFFDNSFVDAYYYFRKILLRIQSLFDINNGKLPLEKEMIDRMIFVSEDDEIFNNLTRMKKVVTDNYRKFYEK